jgi:MFS superfamily sulfate permease-like transporter
MTLRRSAGFARSLFFANAEIFHERVLQAVHGSPTPAHWIVIAAEPVTDIDVTAADMLTQLQDELRELRVNLCFVELKGPVRTA